jgi:4-alpha-glucanotransferase
MQDFLGLGSGARLNTPGTTSNNWRWRMQEQDIDARFAEQVAAMVERNTRVPG